MIKLHALLATRRSIKLSPNPSHTMKNSAIGLILTIGAASVSAQAASGIPANPQASMYLQDGRGIVVRSAQGLCWRTGQWTPADAIPGCDGELVPPIIKATAPPIISPSQPTPAPVTTTAAAPQRCDFEAVLGDEAFAFNQATLSRAAKKRIEEVLSNLGSCADIDAITVTGYTDRLGSQQYNLRLSEKRARTVAQHLNAAGVRTTIGVAGAGETKPINECSDTLPRKRLIECLSPNRRVVIEVRGFQKPPAAR